MSRRQALGAAALVLLGLALWQGSEAALIHAKAWLARGLVASAWARTLAGEAAVRPWPWADTWPVARLVVPRLGIDTIVLAGASGRTIAFGPGHLTGSPLPGRPGNSIIGGHRDTNFRFLARLRTGDALSIQDTGGVWHRYRVTAARTVDARTARLDPVGEVPRLVLVTCFPFDALRPGGPLRYLVFAEKLEPAVATAASAR